MASAKKAERTVEILIAEDSPTQAAQLAALLEEQGYVVTAAANGREALKAARAHRPALVISDVVMPELDGYGLCRALKSDAALKDIPVVLVTTLSDPLDVIRGLECGADNFIRKPYEARYLLSRIEYLLMNLELRKNQNMQMGLEINLGGQRQFITAERQQILDLLISTYEQAVQLNGELEQREKQLERSNQVLQGLYRIADGLNAVVGERHVAETALERAMELPGVKSGWITLREGSDGFRLVAARNLPPALAAPGALDGPCLCRRKLIAGELDSVTNMLECERLARAPGDTQGLKAHASVPIWIGGEALGVMNLVGDADGIFDDADAPNLYSVGNQLGIAFARARLHEGLEHLVEERTAKLAAEVSQRKRAQEEQARLVAILEATPDLVGTATPDGNLLYLNRAGRRMLGVGEEADVSSISIPRTHPEWAARLLLDEGFPHALREGIWSGETALLGPDGREIPILQVILAHRGADGSVAYLSTVARDITLRKRMEKTLLQREAALRHAQSLAKLAHLVARADGGLESWSDTLPLIAGCDPDQVPSSLREWLALVHPADRERLREVSKEAATRGTRLDEQYRVRRADASWAWLRQVSEPAAAFDSADRKQRWLVTLQDITEAKRSEEEVRLLLAVTDGMSSAADVPVALEVALRTICEASGWDCAEAWLEEQGVPRAAAVWHIEDPAIERFARQGRERQIAIDTTGSLMLATWQSGEPSWIPDLTRSRGTTRFLRRADAIAAGLRAILAVTVPGHDGKPLAGLLLLRRAVGAQDERMVRLIVGVARQLGTAIERKQAADRLAANEALLRKVLDTLPVGVRVADRKGAIVIGNPAVERIWGGAGPARGADRPERKAWWADTARRVEPGQWALDRAVRDGKTSLNELIDIESLDGTRKTILSAAAPIVDASGGVAGGVEVTEDITERRAQEKRIARLTRMHAMLSGINSTIVRVKSREDLFNATCRLVVDTGGFLFVHIRMINQDRTELAPAAYAGPENLAIHAVDVRDSAPPLMVAQAYRTRHVVACNDLEADADRSPLRVEAKQAGCAALAALPIQAGEEVFGVVTIASRERNAFDDEEVRLLDELAGDVGFALDHLGKEERISYLALYDSLTDLANRTLFQDRIGQLVHAGRGFVVAAINIVRFRRINETFGMHKGDAVLKRMAARLAENATAENVGRIAADTFGAIREGVGDASGVARWVEGLRAALTQPIAIDGTELRIDVRIGVAVFPSDGASSSELFANAESALERARKGGEPFVAYRPELNARVAERLLLENRLRQAVEQEQFVLHYQPKLDLQRGTIIGAEALIRWQDPEAGLIGPGMFIPVLEETGLILQVGQWVLKTASAAWAQWKAAGLLCPSIAVNVSQIQMRRPDFAEQVIAAVASGGGAGGVSLEITETLVMESIEDSIAKLRKLREAGIGIAVDDFGTGYSSLAYLSKLPIDALKIDRSFIVNMPLDPNSMTLVSTIITLARAFNLTVVAEGVDSEEQLKLLRLLRCDQVQGFLFHKPLPAHTFEALLRGANGGGSGGKPA